jgi:diadenosine tetraphosphate (Ap4A) HIT family hydrolase
MEEAAYKTREAINGQVERLRQEGICPTCFDLQNDGALYGNRYVIYEDELFKVALETFPRMPGHTIVIYKPHREDLSELSPDEAGPVLQMCLSVTQALERSLGAGKVYLNTMCDGSINHLHLQLFPRYPGEPIGSTRFVLPRQPISEGEETTRRVRAALDDILAESLR